MNNLQGHVTYLKSGQMHFGCGWMVDPVAQLVRSLVMYYKPDLVIHTGFLWGKSSLFILDGLDSIDDSSEIEINRNDGAFSNFVDNHSPESYSVRTLIAVDNNMFNIDVERNVKYLERVSKSNIYFYRLDSTEFFKSSFKLPPYKFLMGVVDGDHTDEGCRKDLQSLHDLGAKILLVDDTTWLPSLGTVSKTFADRHGYKYFNFELYNGLAILVREE